MRNHVESIKYFILTSFTMYVILCSEESFLFRSNKIFSFNTQLPYNFTSRNSFHRNNSKRSFQIQNEGFALFFVIRCLQIGDHLYKDSQMCTSLQHKICILL